MSKKKKAKEVEKKKNKQDIAESNEPAEDISQIEIEDKEEEKEENAEEKVTLDPLMQLEEELAKSRDDHLRLVAEFDNYKKRTARDFGNLVKNANESLIIEFLDILDNFERALASGEEKPDFQSYHQGMKLIFDKIVALLNNQGLTCFESVGEKFDPNLHEAITQMESDDYDPDHIAQEFQAGYKLNDKVIRHAKVGVVSEKDSQ